MAEEKAENKVLINTEDLKNIRDFFTHFNITIPSFLETFLGDIEKAADITIEHQNKLKTLIARTIVESDHEIFKDSLFEEVIPNCEKEWFNTQFQEDFEEAMED